MFTDTSGECLYCTVADNSLTFWNLENKVLKVKIVIYGFKVSTLNEKQDRKPGKPLFATVPPMLRLLRTSCEKKHLSTYSF